jgi:phospholipid transport system substrate-binding protein
MRIERRAMLLGLALAAFALGLAAPVGRAHATADPGAFVQQLGNQAIETLTGGDVTAEERRSRFRTLLQANFDVPAIGKTVLGRYWKVATPEEQQEYLGLFENFLVKNYAKRFAEYSGQTFDVRGTRSEPGNNLTVQTVVKQPDSGDPARLDWLLRPDGDGFKILDLKIEGISMTETHRSEFASVIQSKGGKVAGLLEALKSK